MKNKEIIEKIQKSLFENQDIKYKQFQSSLCPGVDNIIGVRVPVLRKIAKILIKQYGSEILLENIGSKYYEEAMLQGLIIGYSKFNIDELQHNLEKFIPKIDNWATCDITCSTIKLKENELQPMWQFLQKYAYSENEFEARFVIVMWLDNFLNDTYICDILNCLSNIKNDAYYVKMAIAWLLSVAFVKQRNATLHFLKNTDCLDDFTYNKTLQKIIESFRVSEQDKELIRNMKKSHFI